MTLRAVVLLAALAALGCASGPEERLARWEGPLDPAKARAIVAEAFSKRAHPNPHLDQPMADHRIVSIDDRRVVFRETGAQGAPAKTVWFRDVTRVSTQTNDDVPSRPETLLVHLASGSESARSVDPSRDLLALLGIADPYLVLPDRDRLLVPRFREALRYLQEAERPESR